MVKIEYSSNSLASCQSCRHKILYGQIRVCVKAASSRSHGGYGGVTFINRYHHANCYTNRRDFTKFYGFDSLIEEDQKRFMSTAQIRERFGPEDEGKDEETGAEAAVAAVATPTPATPAKGTGKRKDVREGPAAGDEKKEKDDNGEESTERILTVTGLKYSAITAVPGQKVALVRELENKYDANAVKVTNVAGQTIGHIKKEEAAVLSPFLAKIENEGKQMADCAIFTCGDGYTQKMRFSLVEKERAGDGKEKNVAAALPTSNMAHATKRASGGTQLEWNEPNAEADFEAAVVAATEAAEATMAANSKSDLNYTAMSPTKLLKIDQGDKKSAGNTFTAAATPNRKIINPYLKKTKCSSAKKVTP